MNISRNPESIFRNMLCCCKCEFNDKLEVISKTIAVDQYLKRRHRGTMELLAMFETEQERIDALEKEFGVTFTIEEKAAVKGSKVAVEHQQPHSTMFD
jgi:hypothetical protein